LYFGTSRNQIYRVDNAHTGNPSFQYINPIVAPFFLTSGYVSSIEVDPRDADKVLVVVSNYNMKSIHYSDNGGSTWTDVSGNLEQFPGGAGNGPSCRTISILPIGNKTAYLVGTSIGLFVTDTLNGSSTTWAQIGKNTIGNTVVEMIKTRTSDGFVAVGTHGNGVFTTYITNINQVTAIQASFQQLGNFELNIFPNPSSKIISISFDLPKRSKVGIIIYDELGRKVDEIIDDEVLSTGEYNFRYNVAQLNKGIYYCRLSHGSLITSKTFVVVNK